MTLFQDNHTENNAKEQNNALEYGLASAGGVISLVLLVVALVLIQKRRQKDDEQDNEKGNGMELSTY